MFLVVPAFKQRASLCLQWVWYRSALVCHLWHCWKYKFLPVLLSEKINSEGSVAIFLSPYIKRKRSNLLLPCRGAKVCLLLLFSWCTLYLHAPYLLIPLLLFVQREEVRQNDFISTWVSEISSDAAFLCLSPLFLHDAVIPVLTASCTAIAVLEIGLFWVSLWNQLSFF